MRKMKKFLNLVLILVMLIGMIPVAAEASARNTAISIVKNELTEYTDTEISKAKAYTDTSVAALVNSAPETMDTISELGNLILENESAIDALDEAITYRATKTELNSHTNNTTAHITSGERSDWNIAKTHADSTHAPSNAEPNQNAFSVINIGSIDIVADEKSDILTIRGSNVTLTPNASDGSFTIGITKENIIAALGYIPADHFIDYSSLSFDTSKIV